MTHVSTTMTLLSGLPKDTLGECPFTKELPLRYTKFAIELRTQVSDDPHCRISMRSRSCCSVILFDYCQSLIVNPDEGFSLIGTLPMATARERPRIKRTSYTTANAFFRLNYLRCSFVKVKRVAAQGEEITTDESNEVGRGRSHASSQFAQTASSSILRDNF